LFQKNPYIRVMTQPVLPQRRTALIAALCLVLAAGLLAASLLYRPDVSKPSSSGEALVGGPFTMVNHKGETVTEKSFLGQYTLIFFGFTFCPDVCPTELQVMATALNQMGEKGNRITPVFVSVDPTRDTPQVVAEYVSAFHPRMVGLTGTPEQVAGMANAYRVFYSKVENKERPDDYTMDHSSIVYLMGPDGKFLKHFTYSTDPKALAEALTTLVVK
jgi:cytochrome oxidase Cu insertion factor (SCO1/SenC/PrrC family)